MKLTWLPEATDVATFSASQPRAGGDAHSSPDWFPPLPDGRGAIYIADQEVDDQVDLYLGDTCLLCDGFEAGDSGRWD